MDGHSCIDLFGSHYKADPSRLYRRLMARGPLHRVRFPSGVRAWLVTGYDAALSALKDDRLGKDHRRGNAAWRERASIMPEPQHSQLQVHLLHQDAPRHAVLRGLVTDALRPHLVEAARPRWQQLADRLVDAMPARGPVDLVRAFAAPFPFQVLAETIGLPEELAGRFRPEWRKVVQPVGPTDPRRPTYEALLTGLQSYIATVVAFRRTHQGEDLLSRLVAARDAGVLTRAELDSMIFQLLVAGQEPVTNQVSTAMVALLRRPRLMDQLRQNPGLVPRAVEELLRFDAAFELATWRFFDTPADLHGTTVPAGDSVIVSLWAANRDAAAFGSPDEIDVDRGPNRHLAFGHGSHFCPGAAMGRIELRTALQTLLARLPGLRLAESLGPLDWTNAVLARGVNSLSVTYDDRLR